MNERWKVVLSQDWRMLHYLLLKHWRSRADRIWNMWKQCIFQSQRGTTPLKSHPTFIGTVLNSSSIGFLIESDDLRIYCYCCLLIVKDGECLMDTTYFVVELFSFQFTWPTYFPSPWYVYSSLWVCHSICWYSYYYCIWAVRAMARYLILFIHDVFDYELIINI